METSNGLQKFRKAFNRLKIFLAWLLAILMIGAYAFFIIRVYREGNEALLTFFQGHYTFFIGLPVAGIFAFILVLILEIQKGPINIKIGILKVEGAGSALLFWIIIFWTIVLSIKMLW